MKNDNMDSGRLEAFVDAIIAIVITIIVLGFPQPENTSFEAIWNLKPVFFAYLTSFITCFTMWYSHHNMFHYIKRIDRKVIVSTGIMLFWITLLPFLTIYVAENFNSSIPQLLYGITFVIIEASYLLTTKFLLDIKDNKKLRYQLCAHKVAQRFYLYIVGFIGLFMGIPEIMSVACFVSIAIFYIPIKQIRHCVITEEYTDENIQTSTSS